MHAHKFYQELSGTIDGNNTSFSLPSTPIDGTVRVFVRGLEQFYGDDFTCSGATVTFVVAPQAGDTIYSHYEETA